MRFHGRVLVAITAALVLAGCGESSSNQATSNSPATTSTTVVTVADPTSRTIPEHPDAAYINGVFADLEHALGDARRDVYAILTMSPATYGRINDVYTVAQAPMSVNGFSAASEREHPEAVSAPGDLKITTVSILDVKNNCIVVSASGDWKAIDKNPPPPETWVYQLVLFPQNNGTNPTPWKIGFETEYKQDLLKGYTCENLSSQSS